MEIDGKWNIRLDLFLCRRLDLTSSSKMMIQFSVDKVATYVSIGISNSSIEFFSFEDQEIVLWSNDAALVGNRASGVDVVTGDHSDSDASLLAFSDSVRYFWSDGIFDADDAHAGQVVDGVGFVFPVWFVIRAQMDLIDFGLTAHKVAIGNGNCSESVASHGLDDLMQQSLLHVAREFLKTSLVAVNECAPRKLCMA